MVDEVIRDEQIGLEAMREGTTAGERLDMFLEKEYLTTVLMMEM